MTFEACKDCKYVEGCAERVRQAAVNISEMSRISTEQIIKNDYQTEPAFESYALRGRNETLEAIAGAQALLGCSLTAKQIEQEVNLKLALNF